MYLSSFEYLFWYDKKNLINFNLIEIKKKYCIYLKPHLTNILKFILRKILCSTIKYIHYKF